MNGDIAFWMKLTPADSHTPSWFLSLKRGFAFLVSREKNKWVTRTTDVDLDIVKIDVSGLLPHRFSYCTKSVRSANRWNISKRSFTMIKRGCYSLVALRQTTIISSGLPHLSSIDIMFLPCKTNLVTTLEISFENRNFSCRCGIIVSHTGPSVTHRYRLKC